MVKDEDKYRQTIKSMGKVLVTSGEELLIATKKRKIENMEEIVHRVLDQLDPAIETLTQELLDNHGA